MKACSSSAGCQSKTQISGAPLLVSYTLIPYIGGPPIVSQAPLLVSYIIGSVRQCLPHLQLQLVGRQEVRDGVPGPVQHPSSRCSTGPRGPLRYHAVPAG